MDGIAEIVLSVFDNKEMGLTKVDDDGIHSYQIKLAVVITTAASQ